jgi:acetoin utilization deacetylase AcuC-like enzyme
MSAAAGASSPSLLVVYARHDLDEAALSNEGQGVNKPVVRKRRILDALHAETTARSAVVDAGAAAAASAAPLVRFEALTDPAPSFAVAERVHAPALLDLFATGFSRWLALGSDKDLYFTPAGRVNPPDFSELVPSASTCRDPYQRAPKESIHAQVNYFCQDRTTPITANTSALLHHDLAVTLRSVQSVVKGEAKEVYACTTQPGHHSGRESYGGYCFINQASLAASLLQEHFGKVALIDVDYHAGNGSMSIFYEDENVFFSSIHADPLISYPYTVGFADQTGAGAGAGSTLNVCLGQNTSWKEYAPALEQVLTAVKNFGARALVVSLGVDTLLGDPEAAPLGGFALHGSDYDAMGSMIRAAGLPTIWVQEGGYKLDEAGDVVRHILLGATAAEAAKQQASK